MEFDCVSEDDREEKRGESAEPTCYNRSY